MFNVDPNLNIYSQTEALIGQERNLLANLSNFSSLIYHSISNLNWAGFYLSYPDNPEELVLGPFCGKPACIRIKSGKGVCGTSFKEVKTIEVPDVNKFPGHIFCDHETKSELVVPLTVNGRTLGVFDIDSTLLGRFSDNELVNEIEKSISVLINKSDWNMITSIQ